MFCRTTFNDSQLSSRPPSSDGIPIDFDRTLYYKMITDLNALPVSKKPRVLNSDGMSPEIPCVPKYAVFSPKTP